MVRHTADAPLNETMRPQRVALVASYAPSLRLFRKSLIEAMRAAGHEVLALAPELDPALSADLQTIGAEPLEIPLSRTGLNPFSDLASLRALTNLFREHSPDVVMGYTPKPSIYASLAARRAGVPRIIPMVTGLGYAFLEGGGLKARLVRQVTTALYARAFAASHGVVFHNADDRAVLNKAGCLPPDLQTFVVSGSGVDLNHFSAAPLPPVSQGLTFLMIARLVGYKGIAEYVEAAAAIKRQSPASRFLLAGPEESGPAGYPLGKLSGAGSPIEYLGAVDDVRPLLAQAHIYVLPSYGEGMPRTVLEALATGRPIITTDARGCRETVTPGKNGLLVTPRDAASLADAMTAMLKRPDGLVAMAGESRRLAEQKFDVEKVNQAMLDAMGLSGAS